MTLKIALCSDVHLEFGDLNIKNEENADVLVLSGDIMIAQELHDHPESDNTVDQMAIANGTGLGRRQQNAKRYRDFLKRCSSQFQHVVYIAGNHEFYHGSFPKGIEYLRSECEKFPNVYFMENDHKKIGDYTFIGCTLWTDMNKGDPITLHTMTTRMNDYNIIRNSDLGYTKLRPMHTKERHLASVNYIRTTVENHKDEKYVVVGHMAPSKLSTHPYYSDETITNGAYSSDLSQFMLDHPQIKIWTMGHTHHVHRYYIGDTLVVCNPRGYIGYEPLAETFKLRYIDLDQLPPKFEGVDWEWN